MKKVISYLLICICCFSLCGCTPYPSMSDEDLDLVAEYAAGLLLKHSATAQNRLIDVEEALQVLEEESKKEEPIEEPVDETEEKPEDPIQPENPVIDNAEQNEEVPLAPINDAMGVNSLNVQFNGYEIKDSYPDGSGAFFALDAGAGNKLLVVKLTLTNNTDNSVDINMLEQNVSFKVSLDGSGYKFVLSTMLLDDLSTYVGTLETGSSTQLVLISEWKEEDLANISSPTLYIKNGELSGNYPID